MQVALPGDQNNASTTWWPHLEHMPVAKFVAFANLTKIDQQKWGQLVVNLGNYASGTITT